MHLCHKLSQNAQFLEDQGGELGWELMFGRVDQNGVYMPSTEEHMARRSSERKHLAL